MITSENLTRLFTLIALVVGILIWGKFAMFYSQAGSDFIQDYFAAQALRSGLPVYGSSIPALAKAVMPDDTFENFHPPFNAVLYLPLTYLSFENAFKLWSAISLCLYLLMVYALSETRQRPYLIAFSLLWYPFIYGIGTGQSSILIASFVCFGWIALKHGRDSWAGVLLAIPCMIKLFPLLLAGFLVMTKRWKALRAWSCTLLAMLLLTYVVVGATDMLHYVREVAAEDVRLFGAIPLNVSLTGMLLPLLTKNGWTTPLILLPVEQAVLITNFLSAVLGVLSLWWAFKLALAQREQESFCILLVAMVLCSPISWMHVYPVLFLPLITTWRRLSAPDHRILRAVFIFNLILLSLPDVTWTRLIAPYFHGVGFPLHVFLMLKLPSWALVVLLFLLQIKPEKARSSSAS